MSKTRTKRGRKRLAGLMINRLMTGLANKPGWAYTGFITRKGSWKGMADYEVGYKKPPKSGQIKKGEIRNPLGGATTDPIVRAARRLAAHEVAEIGTLVMARSTAGLRELIKDGMNNPDSKHSVLKVWMARIALKGILKGDASAMDVLLNRLIGRTKERIEIAGYDGGPVRGIIGNMTPEDRARELKRIQKLKKVLAND